MVSSGTKMKSCSIKLPGDSLFSGFYYSLSLYDQTNL